MSIDAILIERKKDFSDPEKSFETVGQNTGNLLFRESLLKNVNLACTTFEEYIQCEHIFKNIPIITTDLIWINERSDFEWLYKRVERIKDAAFVPMSVGLQNKEYDLDFKLNDTVLRTLSAIQERAIIGVRGEYTAEILNRHGIKNMEVIGCPSLFYEGNPNFQIFHKKGVNNVSINFRTFYGTLSATEKHFLAYCRNKNYMFIEQTRFEFDKKCASDDKYYDYIASWLKKNKKIFFDVDEWRKYISQYDFAMGLRFHGNVVALWNRIPALFFTIDSRTKELTDYFRLPHLSMEEFDEHKPIEYYYDIADYSEFNNVYKDRFNRYYEFMYNNKLININPHR